MGSRTLGSPSVLKRKAKCPFPRGLVAGGSSYALLFRLVSRPLCLRVLPLCRASTRCSRCSAYGRGEGGKYIFSKFFPAAFSIDGRICRGTRDLIWQFFFFFVSSSSFWTDFPLEFWYFWEEFWDFFNCSKWFCRFETCKRRVFCGDWDRSQYQHFVVRIETKKRCLIMIGD